MFQGRTDDMEEYVCKSSIIKLETASKSELCDEVVNHSYNDGVKKETETGIANRDDMLDFVKREEGIYQNVQVKIEPEMEVSCDSHYDVKPVLVKKKTSNSTATISEANSETDNEKKSPLDIFKATTLRDDKQATPTDILMNLKKNNFGLLN